MRSFRVVELAGSGLLRCDEAETLVLLFALGGRCSMLRVAGVALFREGGGEGFRAIIDSARLPPHPIFFLFYNAKMTKMSLGVL